MATSDVRRRYRAERPCTSIIKWANLNASRRIDGSMPRRRATWIALIDPCVTVAEVPEGRETTEVDALEDARADQFGVGRIDELKPVIDVEAVDVVRVEATAHPVR